MNKYNIQEFLSEKLKNYTSTLKETSFDSANNEYLCADEQTANVYNFDAYIAENFEKTPASPDAIYIGSKKLYFVEFKNQKTADIDTAQLKRKFESGTQILKNQLLKDFVPQDIDYIFCVVYKKSTRNRYFDPSAIEANATKFGLEEKNKELGGFYTKIITDQVEFYKEEFTDLQC